MESDSEIKKIVQREIHRTHVDLERGRQAGIFVRRDITFNLTGNGIYSDFLDTNMTCRGS